MEQIEQKDVAPKKSGSVFSLIFGIIGAIYLLNPTAGLLELIPDNLPVIGNLDEAAATLLVVNAVRYLRNRFRSKQ
jgi:uncharacterized membrane protein YkvA (DUF1232 family)